MSAFSRRRFLVTMQGSLVALLAGTRSLAGLSLDPRRRTRKIWEHPTPRSGIDASKVLTAEDLEGFEDLVPIYEGIREIPHIADGIRCHCGCAELPTYRSLLTCYEEGSMAKYCEICQGQGRLAYRRHKEGQTLDQIRIGIDARFGHHDMGDHPESMHR